MITSPFAYWIASEKVMVITPSGKRSLEPSTGSNDTVGTNISLRLNVCRFAEAFMALPKPSKTWLAAGPTVITSVPLDKLS